MFNKGLVSRVYKELSNLNRKANIIIKNGKNLNRCFTKKDMQLSYKMFEQTLTIISAWGSTKSVLMRYHYVPNRMDKTEKSDHSKCQ